VPQLGALAALSTDLGGEKAEPQRGVGLSIEHSLEVLFALIYQLGAPL